MNIEAKGKGLFDNRRPIPILTLKNAERTIAKKMKFIRQFVLQTSCSMKQQWILSSPSSGVSKTHSCVWRIKTQKQTTFT